jgi:hypothetical protein
MKNELNAEEWKALANLLAVIPKTNNEQTNAAIKKFLAVAETL